MSTFVRREGVTRETLTAAICDGKEVTKREFT
jgi:hypothetical protein